MSRLWSAALTLAVLLAAAAHADAASLYWLSYDSGNSRVGRVNVDGTGANPSLVTGIYYGAGIASNGTNVFWGESGNNPTPGRVGRATVAGVDVNHAFLNGGSTCSVFGHAANATHVYWLWSDCVPGGRVIGRAEVGGTNSQPSFITGIPYACGITIDATYVYWSRDQWIGRAKLDGTEVDNTWLDAGGNKILCGVAVTASHIYWTVHFAGGGGGTTIGRATIDGAPASVNNTLVTGAKFTGSASSPSGIAADDTYVYWGNQEVAGTIGRAKLDGTEPNQSFVTGVYYPLGLAIDPSAAAPPDEDDPAPDPPAKPTEPGPPPPAAATAASVTVTQPPAAVAPRPAPPAALRLDEAVVLPTAKRCASRRSFRIRIRNLAGGAKIARADVSVNGRRVQIVRGARLRAPVDLRNLPGGRFTVAISVVTADGRKVSGTRRYRTCAPKKQGRGKRGPL